MEEKKIMSEADFSKVERDTKKAIKEEKKTYKVMLPEVEGEKFLVVSINGVRFTVERGVEVDVPEQIYRIIENMKTQKRMQEAVEKKLIKGIEFKY